MNNQDNDQWIDINKEKPEIGKRVLISGIYNTTLEAVRYEDNKFNRFGTRCAATHWQPLPEPFLTTKGEECE